LVRKEKDREQVPHFSPNEKDTRPMDWSRIQWIGYMIVETGEWIVLDNPPAWINNPVKYASLIR
jgi:hypothetical protein